MELETDVETERKLILKAGLILNFTEIGECYRWIHYNDSKREIFEIQRYYYNKEEIFFFDVYIIKKKSRVRLIFRSQKLKKNHSRVSYR